MIRYKSKNNRDWYKRFQGLDGFDAMGELGALGKITEQAVVHNKAVLEKILSEERKYSNTDSLSFDEVVRQYNQGISEDELRAWVWYQRGQGEKMKGWEQYFMKLASDTVTSVFVKNHGELGGQKAMLKDNHFRDQMELDWNIQLGTFTGKRLEYDKEYYLIVKTDDKGANGIPKNALVYIREKEVTVIRHEGRIDEAILVAYVKKGILFYLAGQLLPYPIYAYGNMYDRELQLAKDKDHIIASYGMETYEHQYQLIHGTLRPKLLSVINPDLSQRPKILSISKFAKDFRVESLREETGVEMDSPTSLFEAFKLWLEKLDPTEFNNVNYAQIVRYYLDGDNLSKKLTEDQKMTIEKYGMIEAEELFTRFLNKAINFEDQQKIDFSWNRTYNGHSAIPVHKVPIGFECSAMFKQGVLRFSQTQREAIAFMEIARSGIIAYDVGVGKTMAAIITLANNLYSGKCQRPLIVVPNPTFGKWLKEIIGYTDPQTKQFVPGVLSNVGYKVNEWYNLGKDYKGKIKPNAKVEAKTITVVTYEGFGKIGLGLGTVNDFFEEMASILNQDDVADLTPREREKRNQGYREMLGMGNKGTIADIDTLGFDYIVIDEAHNFKNVFDNVLAEKGVRRFKIQGSQSTRAVKAFFICNYIQRTYGRNVMLLTATPFTNSPLEIYSMLSLVAYNYMKANGLSNVQRFMESFILQTLEYVNSYDDTLKEQHVVKSFNNRLILQQLIFNHIAYRTGEEAGVKRPCKVNLPRLHARNDSGQIKRLDRDQQVLTYLEMTPQQKQNQEEIVALAKSASPGDGNLMRALSHSLDNAVSPFLYKGNYPPEDYMEFVEESPKIKYVVDCIRSVKKWHEERMEPVSGQVIYINRGKEYFRYIKEYLEKELGYRQKVKHHKDTVDEVEIITSGMTQEKKETIKDAFLEGVCKIIIGTSTIREGIDLQKNSAVLYNCYPDWNPTDVKQLEGRIWRQGNTFGYVRVVMPLVQDSMDIFVFQKLEEKTARINDLWYRGGSANVIDLESIDPEEVKFALFTNIQAITGLMLGRLQKDVERKLTVAENNVNTLFEFEGTRKKYYDYQKKVLAELKGFQLNLTLLYFSGNNSYAYQQWWIRKDNEAREAIKAAALELIDEIMMFFASVPQEDKEAIRLCRKALKLYQEMDTKHQATNTISQFRALVSEVRKAEESIIKEKGFTLNDNLLDIIQAYRSEKDRLTLELDDLKSYEYREKLMDEVRAKKEKLAVSGESPELRAREFAALNYLLSYRASDVDGDLCILPENEIKREKATDNTTGAHEFEMLKLRARALALKLKLRQYKKQAT